MPTARYWRMGVGASTGNTFVTLVEVQFLDATFTDVSVGGTAFSSSVHTSGQEADKAFDKNLATWWRSAAYDFPSYIGYDHGSPVDVAYVRFRGFATSEYPAAVGVITVQWSDDGTTWSSPFRVRVIDGTFIHNEYATVALWDGTLTPVSVDSGFFTASATPLGLQVAFLTDGSHPYRDFEFGGSGRIAGTVKEDGSPDVPVKRRVRLHREIDGRLIREVWSEPVTGAYSFDHIDATKKYTVITYDYEHDYRAVIADNITPEAMP